MDVYQDDIITQEDPKPKPALAEEHRAKLDSIIQQMIKNKESDDNINMVVNDFKQKYGQVQPVQQQPKTASIGLQQPNNYQIQISQPTFKLAPDQTGERTFTNQATTPELKFQQNALKAHDIIQNELKGNKDIKADMIKQRRFEQAALKVPISKTDMPKTQAEADVQRLIPQAPKPQELPVTEEDLAKEDADVMADRGKAVRLLEETMKKYPEKAKELQKNIYRIDAANSLAPGQENRLPKIEENAKRIDKGQLVYDARSGRLLRPMGLLDSAIEGWKQDAKNVADYDFLQGANNDDILNEYHNRQKEVDIDKPIPVPKGKLSEIAQMIGGMPLKPLAAGAIGSLGGPEAGGAAATLVGGRENQKREYAGTFWQTLDELIKKGTPENEAVDKARELAGKAGQMGAITGAAMGLAGARMADLPFAKPVLSNSFKQAAFNVLKQSGSTLGKAGLEGLTVGGIGAAGQYYKNKLAQEAGIFRPLDQGLADQLEGGLMMTVAMAAAIKAGRGISKGNYQNLLHGLSKMPDEQIGGMLQDKVQNGEITQKAADETQQRINEYRGLDKLIPDNVSDEARFKIQDKIKKRQDYEAQLETQDKAYHPEIKEKIKTLDEDIVNLTKEGKEKPIKEESGLTKDQEKEATEIAEEWLHEGIIPNTYEGSIKKDPIGFWKFMSQQAHNMDENWRPNEGPSPEQGMREDLGDTVVDYAKELFPAPEVKETPKSVSVIQPGEIKRPEVTTIAPSEAGAGKVAADQIGHVEISEHGEDTKTAEGKENGIGPSKLSEKGKEEARQLGEYLVDNNKKKVITSEVERAQETAQVAAQQAGIPIEYTPVLNTWNIGEYDGRPEGSFVEEAWTNKPNEAPKGGESFNDFTKRMEQAYQFVKTLPEDNHVVSHSKVMRALEALKETDGKWTDETTKEFLTNKELPNAVPIEKSNALDVREQATNGEAMGAGNAEPESIAGKEGRIQEVNQGTGKEKVGEPIRIGITHAQMDNIAREFGFDTYEKSPEKVKEWDEQAAKRLQDPNALNDLFTKLRNGDIPDKVETRMMLQYMADLMAKIEKTPLDETLLQQLKRTKDLFNIAGREQGKALVARKGSVPTEETLGDFLIRDMEANKAPLTDKQKETAVNEYNDIKEANEKYQKELERVRAENNKLKAEKEIKKVSAKTKKQPKKDYSTERKEIINDIREKLRKARGETSVVAVPYAKELIAIAPDVAKLVKSLVEEGIEKLPDIVKNIHGQLKEFIPEIKEKDVHDIIAGEYNKKKSKNELSEKLYNLKLEAQLANKLEAKEAGIQPKNERQKIKRNQEIEALRQKIKDFDEEVAKAKRESKEAVKQASKKTPEQIALDTIKTRTKNEIARIEEQLRTGDFTEPEKQPIKLDKEAQDAKDKLWKLKQEREVRLIKEKYKNQSAFDKGKDAVTNVLNAPRSIMSSMDYSAPLRQGLVASVAHPTLAAKAIKYMFKASASQKQFDRWFMDLKDSPDYHEMVDSGLALADPHDPTATAHEEAFMSHLPEKIPGIGRLIKGSERAYTGFLNKMRVDSFRRLTDSFKTDGKTFENSPELYKAAADYVNATTGRGKLPEIMDKSAPLLNALFFSPRLIASRLQLLFNPINPNFYRNVPKEVRVQYFKDMAKFVIAGTTMLGLAKLAGADVEKDPRSTDFGKIKVGNTRWDIWGGFQQYVRFFSQLITGERKSATTGTIDELTGEGRFGKTRGDITTTFLRGKLAPIPAAVWDILSGRTVVGEKLHYSFTEPTEGRDINLTDEAKKMLLPLIYSDIKDAWQQQGWPSIITVGVPATFGVGTQTFDNSSGGNGGGAGAGGSYEKPTRTRPEKPHKTHR